MSTLMKDRPTDPCWKCGETPKPPTEDDVQRAAANVRFCGAEIDQRAREVAQAQAHLSEALHRLAVAHEHHDKAITTLIQTTGDARCA